MGIGIAELAILIGMVLLLAIVPIVVIATIVYATTRATKRGQTDKPDG